MSTMTETPDGMEDSLRRGLAQSAAGEVVDLGSFAQYATDETYNGYANRETWAFNLHWGNDQGLYNGTLEAARVQVEVGGEITDYELGEAVVRFWRTFLDDYESDFGSSLPEALRMFEREVGSWWRIDYAEVGAAVRESLDNES